jgi:hypothetical protein
MHSSAPVWRKSSHSNGNCVEIAWRRGSEGINIVVRDSKFPGRDPLVFTPGEWAVFLDRVKSEDFDVLAGSGNQGPAQGSLSGPAVTLPGDVRVLGGEPAPHHEQQAGRRGPHGRHRLVRTENPG